MKRAALGGQIVVSEVTPRLVTAVVPEARRIAEPGAFRLKDLSLFGAGPRSSLAGCRAIERRWSYHCKWAEQARAGDDALHRAEDHARLGRHTLAG